MLSIRRLWRKLPNQINANLGSYQCANFSVSQLFRFKADPQLNTKLPVDPSLFLAFEQVEDWKENATLRYFYNRDSSEQEGGSASRWNLTKFHNGHTLAKLAKHYALWDLTRLLIDRHLESCPARSLLDLAHSLALMRSHGVWNDEDNRRRELLKAHVDKTPLPAPIKNPTVLFLLCCDPTSVLTTPSLEAPNCAADDSFLHLCLEGLRRGDWDQFRSFFLLIRSSNMLHHPVLLYTLATFLQGNQTAATREMVYEWFFDNLSSLKTTVDSSEFEIFQLTARVLNSTLSPCHVPPDGHVGPSRKSKEILAKLPSKAQFDPKLKEACRDALRDYIATLVKTEGSISSQEVKFTKKSVDSLWESRSPDSSDALVVVDTLNVAHNFYSNSHLLRVIKNSAFYQKGSMILVTRKFLSSKIKMEELSRHIAVVTANRHSEDDLLVLFAALEWKGPSYMLTNDRFTNYIQRIKNTDQRMAKVFADWIRESTVHFDKETWKVETEVEYNRCVQPLPDQLGYLVPIHKHHAHIPEYSFYIAEPPN